MEDLCTIGTRFISDGNFGTIWYVGEVPPTKGLWLGVEWDDPTRGKHDGSHDGKQYFKTSHPTSGSFLRVKKADLGVTFVDALSERYGRVDDAQAGINEEDMYVKGKNQQTFVEVVGAQSVNLKQSKFDQLLEVALRNRRVCCVESDDILRRVIPNVKELDISLNLLSSWYEVARITAQLHHLVSLNISNSPLLIPEDPATHAHAFSKLQIIYMNRMNYDWDKILRCCWMLQSLQELHLCFNKITSITAPHAQLLQHLTLLNLESNQLDGWSDILHLGHLPKLEALILNDTGMKDIRFKDTEYTQKTCLFPKLKSLSLSHNNISEWTEVDELNKLASLQELTLRHNPLLLNKDENTVRQMIIAKLAGLQLLNRTEVLADERKGAEYDYLKMFGKSWKSAGGDQDSNKNNPSVEFSRSHPRYQQLLDKYGAPEDSELVQISTALKHKLLNVKIVSRCLPNRPSLSKKLPATMTVQKLKTLVQRLYKVNAMDIRIAYTSAKVEGPEIEFDNDMREIRFYAIENDDTIHVTW